MRKNKQILIIEKLLIQGTSTAGKDTGISNANQYYAELEKRGITASKWVSEKGVRFKQRFIKDRAKAYEFLNRFKTKGVSNATA